MSYQSTKSVIGKYTLEALKVLLEDYAEGDGLAIHGITAHPDNAEQVFSLFKVCGFVEVHDDNPMPSKKTFGVAVLPYLWHLKVYVSTVETIPDVVWVAVAQRNVG